MHNKESCIVICFINLFYSYLIKTLFCHLLYVNLISVVRNLISCKKSILAEMIVNIYKCKNKWSVDIAEKIDIHLPFYVYHIRFRINRDVSFEYIIV